MQYIYKKKQSLKTHQKFELILSTVIISILLFVALLMKEILFSGKQHQG